MKKLLFTLCFCLIFSFATEAQATVVYYSFPSQHLSIYSGYPVFPWYRIWYDRPAYLHKKYPKGNYYSWKRNNFYYTKLSAEKMAAYKASHAENQNINPIDDPQFLNDVKVYSLPNEAQITTTPKEKESNSNVEIQSPTTNAESQNKIAK